MLNGGFPKGRAILVSGACGTGKTILSMQYIYNGIMNYAEPGVYEHYSGRRYELVGVARHSETLEPLVVYRALYDDHDLWVRPFVMFFEEVEVDNRHLPRFRKIR